MNPLLGVSIFIEVFAAFHSKDVFSQFLYETCGAVLAATCKGYHGWRFAPAGFANPPFRFRSLQKQFYMQHLVFCLACFSQAPSCFFVSRKRHLVCSSDTSSNVGVACHIALLMMLLLHQRSLWPGLGIVEAGRGWLGRGWLGSGRDWLGSGLAFFSSFRCLKLEKSNSKIAKFGKIITIHDNLHVLN